MKKKLIISTVCICSVFASFSLALNSNYPELSFYMGNVEALTATETKCIVSSNSKDNTGTCKKTTNGTSDVCVTPGLWDDENCNTHE